MALTTHTITQTVLAGHYLAYRDSPGPGVRAGGSVILPDNTVVYTAKNPRERFRPVGKSAEYRLEYFIVIDWLTSNYGL